MSKADVINITGMTRLDDSDASVDLIDELYAGVGCLLHIGGSESEIRPEEITFIADKLHQALNQLQTALCEERRRSAEPQP